MEPKKRIVKDYDNLPEEVINQIKMHYPKGFVRHLITYTNKDGVKVSALPHETEDIYYLIRMSASEARQIILDDDDYEDGILREDFGDDFEAPADADADDDGTDALDDDYDVVDKSTEEGYGEDDEDDDY
jgi:DNA-directed RNA polymerase subunit delta